MFMIARARYERREQQSPVSLNPQPSMEADLQSAQQADQVSGDRSARRRGTGGIVH